MVRGRSWSLGREFFELLRWLEISQIDARFGSSSILKFTSTHFLLERLTLYIGPFIYLNKWNEADVDLQEILVAENVADLDILVAIVKRNELRCSVFAFRYYLKVAVASRGLNILMASDLAPCHLSFISAYLHGVLFALI